MVELKEIFINFPKGQQFFPLWFNWTLCCYKVRWINDPSLLGCLYIKPITMRCIFVGDVSSVSLSSERWRGANTRNSLCWPIYVINSADNTKLPCYIISPTPRHSFFRFYFCCCCYAVVVAAVAVAVVVIVVVVTFAVAVSVAIIAVSVAVSFVVAVSVAVAAIVVAIAVIAVVVPAVGMLV